MGNLKKELRHGITSGDRRESVADHSWRLTLMVFLLGKKCEGLDLEKAIHMALIHDIAEAIVGDLHYKSVTSAHHLREKREFVNFDELLGEYSVGLLDLWTEFNANETAEAKVVNALDKLEACMQHNEAGMITWPAEDVSEIRDYYSAIDGCFPIINEMKQHLLNTSLRLFSLLT